MKDFFVRYKFQIVAGILLLLPICAYITNFCDHGFSEDPAMWGVFGDFIGGVYNVLVAVLVFYVSRHLDKKEAKANKKAKAAYEIKSQIEKFESSKNRTKTVEKLTDLILTNKEVLGKSTYQILMALNDNLQHVVNKESEINKQLKKDVTDALDSFYNE